MKKLALILMLACIFLFAHNTEASEDFSGTITLPRYEYATSWNYDAAVEGTDGAGHYWIGFFPTDAAARDVFKDPSLINLYDISYSDGGLSFAINSGIYVYSCNSDFTVCQVSGNFSHWITAQLIASSYDFGIGVPVTIGTGLAKLTVNLDPPTGGTVTVISKQGDLSCADGVCQGDFSGNVSLLATPAEGWVFAGWYNGTANFNPLTVTMDKNKSITATFKPADKTRQYQRRAIITIDGMDPWASFYPNWPNMPTTYLYDAITSAWWDEINQDMDVVIPFIWSRDIDDTNSVVLDLYDLIRRLNSTNRPVTILSHSWGTVLSYIALTNHNDIRVDKLVTLGSPLRSRNPTILTTTLFWLAQNRIFTEAMPSNLNVWHNYWELFDPISGSINLLAKKDDDENIEFYLMSSDAHSSYFDDRKQRDKILQDVVKK